LVIFPIDDDEEIRALCVYLDGQQSGGAEGWSHGSMTRNEMEIGHKRMWLYKMGIIPGIEQRGHS